MCRPILEINNVDRIFKTSIGDAFYACKQVSLQVYPGETVAVVGESGSGKSTMMKMIMRLLPVSSGQIMLDGCDMNSLKGDALLQARRKIQMVYQNPLQAFNPRMMVKEILSEPLRNYGLVGTKNIVSMLEEVGLNESFLHRYPHEMSGGQCQRVAIARALSLDPEVIILDEATSALDMSVQDVIMELLAKLQREKGVSYLFVCHDIGLAYAFAHRIVVMKHGEIVDRLRALELEHPTHPYTMQLCEASNIFSTH